MRPQTDKAIEYILSNVNQGDCEEVDLVRRIRNAGISEYAYWRARSELLDERLIVVSKAPGQGNRKLISNWAGPRKVKEVITMTTATKPKTTGVAKIRWDLVEADLKAFLNNNEDVSREQLLGWRMECVDRFKHFYGRDAMLSTTNVVLKEFGLSASLRTKVQTASANGDLRALVEDLGRRVVRLERIVQGG